MSGSGFESWIDRAASAVSRRASLAALAGAPLAAGPRADTARSQKKNKNNGGQKARRQALKRCRQQVGDCQQFVATGCQNIDPGDDQAACLARFSPCCDFFATCNAAEAFSCLAQ